MRRYSKYRHDHKCQWVFGFGYVWLSSTGQRWRITRTTDPAGNWIARDEFDPPKSDDLDAGKHPPIYAFTLKAMSLKLSQLEASLSRDPVDAVNDLEYAAELFREHLKDQSK